MSKLDQARKQINEIDQKMADLFAARMKAVELVAMHKTYVKENETLLSRYAWMGAKESGVKLGAGYKKNQEI